MQNPLRITFREMEHSDAVEADIRVSVEKLEQVFDRITSCRVVVEAPHRHHTQGGHFHVLIDLSVPGKEIVVGRDHGDDASHEDVYVALRDAFRAARRQLDEYVRKHRDAA